MPIQSWLPNHKFREFTVSMNSIWVYYKDKVESKLDVMSI
jgi:hypothetical protein